MWTTQWRSLLGIVVGLAAVLAPSASGEQPHHEPSSVVADCASTSATVTWAPVPDTGLAGYDVYARTGAADYAKANEVLVTGTSYTVPGLATGVTYDFAVVAVYADGAASPMSAPASCATA